MTAVSSRRIGELRSIADRLNLHVPPSYFVSSISSEPYDAAIDPISRTPGREPVNLYVGVPLCQEHCSFCMYFYGLADAEGIKAEDCLRGLEQFLDQIAARCQNHLISGSYIGGGTPTVLSASQICRLLAAVGRAFVFEPDAQRTFEMSPRSATAGKIAAIVAGGYNRVSFGVQSFDRAILSQVGRSWADAASVRALIATCRNAGLDEINVDLMTGLDGELDQTLADAVAALVDETHLTISIYRYRPGRAAELAARHGMNDYVSRCADRVSAAVEVARQHGWVSSGRADGEHVRLMPRRYGRWSERNLYETRYRPELGNSLIGVGVGARSFLRDEQMAYCEHRNSAQYELRGRLVQVERCDQLARVCAAVVNGFFRDQRIDASLIEARCGLAPEEALADEFAYLVEQKVLDTSDRIYTVNLARRADWAYLDKLLYPPGWLARRSQTSRLR